MTEKLRRGLIKMPERKGIKTGEKKKVLGGKVVKKKVRGETGGERKKSVLKKTLSVGETEFTFILKRSIKTKKKEEIRKESLFPTFITALFLTLIITAMGYAIYLDVNGKVLQTL